MAKRVLQADGTSCYTENCRIHDRKNYDSTLIVRPDAKALDQELGELLNRLETLRANPASTPKEIKTAEDQWGYIQGLYDITPEGQKRLEKNITKLETAPEADAKEVTKLTRRLKGAKAHWDRIQTELLKLDQKQQRFLEIKNKIASTVDNPYSRMLSKVVVESGDVYSDEKSWGGPNTDYLAGEHFKECGVLAIVDVEEDYSWQTYDSYNNENHSGLGARITCNCGKEVDRRIVVENGTYSTVLGKMFSTFSE